MWSSLPLAAIGVLGLGITLFGCSDSTSPSVPRPLTLETLVAGGSTTCGLDAAGTLYCWGASLDGFPALDSSAPCVQSFLGCLLTPTAAPAPAGFHDLTMSTGFPHLCGIGDDEAMYCAGLMLVTSDGLVSLGNTLTRYGPADPIAGVASGTTHDCAVTAAGESWCWGDYDYNVRGTGGPVDHDYNFVPNLVAGDWEFASLVSGRAHSCGLLPSGQALCWGYPEMVGVDNPPIRVGECGLPAECVDHPVVVNHSRSFTRLASGGPVTCGIDDLTDLYCWGLNAEGWIGDGTTSDRQEPVEVAVPGSVIDVTVGDFSICAITSTGSAYCWGSNWAGQVGTGDTSAMVSTPTRLQIQAPIERIALGADHGCALDNNKRVWCWGLNSQGQLGVGDTLPHFTPVMVPHPN